MNIVLIMILGYLIGSVPFALVIGKVFYNTDVRQHGSRNLGGGNTGRVLGKKAGVAVMTLDILKVAFVVLLAKWLIGTELAMVLGSLAAAAGHCWPVFARFRGGKAVATMYGFLFGMFVFGGHTPLMFFLPLLVFLLVLYLSKIVSLSSIVSAAAITLYAFLTLGASTVSAALVAFTIVIVLRHRTNLVRLLKGQENRITWM